MILFYNDFGVKIHYKMSVQKHSMIFLNNSHKNEWKCLITIQTAETDKCSIYGRKEIVKEVKN